jgi:hypothetical protein
LKTVYTKVYWSDRNIFDDLLGRIPSGNPKKISRGIPNQDLT